MHDHMIGYMSRYITVHRHRAGASCTRVATQRGAITAPRGSMHLQFGAYAAGQWAAAAICFGTAAAAACATRGGCLRDDRTADVASDLKYCTSRSMLKNWRSWSGTSAPPSKALLIGGGDASASRQGSNSMPVEKTVCAGIDLRRRSSEGTCEDACGERSADEVGESM